MAVVADYGKCAQCGDNNLKTAALCRKCGAPLPWAKAPKPQIIKAPRPSAPSPRPAAARSIDWGLWGVALLSFVVPIIGYFLYRSYSENGSDRVGAAGWGALAGVAFHAIRIVLRLTMAPA